MELILVGLVAYVAIQTVMIPVAIVKKRPVVGLIIIYLAAIAAAFFIYTFVVAGSGTVITQ